MFVCSANGKRRLNVQLELNEGSLIIIPNSDANKYSVPNKERVITLPRRTEGGFGVAIKGGREHNLPIIISKILRPDSPSIKLYVGDAIIKVNDASTKNLSREQATELLRCSGESVVLTVKHYKEVASLLKRDEDQASHVDLSFAYVQEIDEQRAFRIQTNNCKVETIVQCSSKSDRDAWIKAIHAAISECNEKTIDSLNCNIDESNKIHWMDWISKKCYFPWNRQRTLPLFLALKGSCVYQFDGAPGQLTDFEDCEVVYKAFQCSLRADAECVDLISLRHYVLETPHHCIRFSLQVGQSGVLERSWSVCVYLSVISLSSKTFSVQFENRAASLTIDWNMGFALYDILSKEYLWKYGFTQYRSNSYEACRVRLCFALKEAGRKGETNQSVSLANEGQAKQLVFCINAFLQSKSAAPK